jgi:hypothetical protein
VKSAEDYQRQGFKLIEEVEIAIKPLKKVLEETCSGKRIDFMSIDTEGYDVEVLLSNDWNKFRPTLLCIEKSDAEIEHILTQNKYSKIAETKVNAVYKAQ